MLGSINFNKLKNKVKIDKTKFKKNILTIGLSFIIGTSFISDGEKIIAKELPVKTVKIKPNKEIYFDETIEEKRHIKTKEEICDEYSLFFKQYQIDYDLEEYLITDEEIDSIIAMSQTDKECEYDLNYSASELIEIIKNNSTEYVKENPEYQSVFREYTYGTSEYDKELYTDQLCFEMFFEKAINIYLEKATNDVNEDMHKMQTLKFVYGEIEQDSTSITLGYYVEEKNLIVLSRDSMDLVAYIYNTKPEYVLYLAIQHELNHVRQHKCDCRVEGSEQIRISYDPNSISSIIEASAESEIHNLNKILSYIKMASYDYSYISERKSESLLFLLALFSADTSIEEYYNSIFDCDWNELLEFFDLDTTEEKHTFFKLLYIIDASKCRNDLPFLYYDKEELESGITFQQLQFDLGYGYKSEIFKICLTELIEYTKKNEDFELIDNLLMLNIIKNKIVDGSYKLELNLDKNEYERIYDESFVNEVLEMENKYVEFLSEYYEVDVEKIRNLEESDIYWYGNCVTNLAIEKTTAYSKGYDEKAKRLLERFPILKSILYTNNYYSKTYEKFINEEDVKQKVYKIN